MSIFTTFFRNFTLSNTTKTAMFKLCAVNQYVTKINMCNVLKMRKINKNVKK